MKVIMLYLLLASMLGVSPVHAEEGDSRLALGGILAGAGQAERLGGTGVGTDSHAVPLQPELSFRINDSHQIAGKLGFAAGNGLNGASPFNISPWAADLENDVKQINGRNRDYLLTAWYRFSTKTLVGPACATIGIIDATDYLDENVFSNDEYSQFMNAALVNAPNVFLPSYDVGAAVELEMAHWALRGVYMNVGENDDGNNFDFLGLQVGYQTNMFLGEGNYRILAAVTDRQFLDPAGTSLQRRAGLLTSFDQQLGPVLGAYVRLAMQDDQAAVDYGRIYSGGFDLKGTVWGRARDNIGAGYAWLGKGNSDIDESQVAEVYYRLAVSDVFALTADVQYMVDAYKTNEIGPHGWILGFRMAATL